MARDELFRARQEKQELEQQMEHSRIEATRLKKRMNKVMNRKRTLQKKKNGKSYRRVAPKTLVEHMSLVPSPLQQSQLGLVEKHTPHYCA
eukprot:15130233-Ditylum_brightwellii.AAC.1